MWTRRELLNGDIGVPRAPRRHRRRRRRAARVPALTKRSSGEKSDDSRRRHRRRHRTRRQTERRPQRVSITWPGQATRCLPRRRPPTDIVRPPVQQWSLQVGQKTTTKTLEIKSESTTFIRIHTINDDARVRPVQGCPPLLHPRLPEVVRLRGEWCPPRHRQACSMEMEASVQRMW